MTRTGERQLPEFFNIDVIWHWLLAYGVVLARPMSMLSVHPVFTRAQLAGATRGAIASAMALPMVPVLAAKMPADSPGAFVLLALTFKEALIGAALGVLLGAPLWALEIAGDVMDAQRGATQGRLNDPAGFEDVSISGTMLVMTGIALFVVTGGLENLSTLLYESWSVWQPLAGAPSVNTRTPLLLLGLLDRITRQGLLMAVPPVFAMLLADAALMVLARIMPQMRVDDLALSLRNIVYLIVMPLYVAFLVLFVRQDFAAVTHFMDLVGAMIDGAGGAR